MTATTIQQALNAGLGHQQAGRLAEANALYQQILAEQPNHPDALHLQGLLSYQTKQYETAFNLIQRAVEIKPNSAAYHGNLGLVLAAQGKLEEAIACFNKALSLQPGHAESYSNLGTALMNLGRIDEAITTFRQVVALRPTDPVSHHCLGQALKKKGFLQEAASAFQQAVALRPNYPEAYTSMGNTLRELGNLSDATIAYRSALALNPNYFDAHLYLGDLLRNKGEINQAIVSYENALALKPQSAEACERLGGVFLSSGNADKAIEIFKKALAIRGDSGELYNNLGNAYKQKGRPTEAIASYRQALRLLPKSAEILANLGNAIGSQGQLDEAVRLYHQAISLRPELVEVQTNLGSALKTQGQLGAAIACFQQTIDAQPNYSAAHSNLVYTLVFHPTYEVAAIRQQLNIWNAHHALPLKKSIQPHPNDRNPDRKLRIGYISPDFRAHCQSLFTVPLLSHHSDAVEVFCYADVLSPDALTDRLKSIVPHWNSIAGQTDQQVADQIRKDQIDILIDLTMHMAGNRLLVLARKPAPVQISYLAYPGSTGVEAIDYRISDPYLDPPGTDLSIYSEQTLLLPNSFWCYDPLEKAEDFPVNPLPALEKGYLTFGCLNNFCKVNDGVLELWARVLKQVPSSRLLLLAPAGSARQRVVEKLKQEGIESSRIEFADFVPRQQYLKTYHRIDLALETLPYHGHTTSLDALWMGVPTPTLIGRTVVGRAGVSILSNVGLTDLIAETPEQYLQKISELANDLPKLNEFRRNLRQKIAASPLMDSTRFARDMEQLYRQAWKRWCGA